MQIALKEALAALSNAIEIKTTKIPGEAQARRSYNYPFETIEELLPNAVYNRDYRISAPITVTKTPTYLEIRSYPGFDRTIESKDIAKGLIQSQLPYRNPAIGNCLKELGLTEGRNTGFPLVNEALKKNGSDNPIYIKDEERNSLRVRLPVHKDFLPKERLKANPPRKAKKTWEEIRLEIISVLTTKESSMTEIARLVGYRSIPLAFREELAKLCDSGQIEKLGNGKTTKYRLK